jgi:hypothetical protein
MDLVTLAGIIVVLTSAILGVNQVILPLWKKVNMALESWYTFTRDWHGEPAEPGREAVPGVMERLNKLDGELSRNGGTSLKDAVDRLEKNQDKICKKIEESDKHRVEAHETLLAAINALAAAKDEESKPKPRAKKKAA